MVEANPCIVERAIDDTCLFLPCDEKTLDIIDWDCFVAQSSNVLQQCVDTNVPACS